MKRIILALALFILMTQVGNAEPMPEWEENATFLYGTSIYQGDGDFLPEAPVDEEILRKGLTIKIQNGMPYADRGIFMLLLNGRIQPFFVDGERQYFDEFVIDANASIEAKVALDELYTTDEEVQYLHVVTVGLLDRMPAHEHDYDDVYTNICSIPFAAEGGGSATISDQLKAIPISDEIYGDTAGNNGYICFSEKIDGEHIYIKPCIEEGTLPYRLEVTAIAPPKALSFLLLVDGEPWPPEGELYSGHASAGCALQATYELDNLQPGAHQICAIMCPIDEAIDVPIATPRLMLCVPECE